MCCTCCLALLFTNAPVSECAAVFYWNSFRNPSAKSAFTICPLILKWVEKNDLLPVSLSLSVFFSLMDREVTLLGEMDKVKAESSKYLKLRRLNHDLRVTCHLSCCWYFSHNVVTWLRKCSRSDSQKFREEVKRICCRTASPSFFKTAAMPSGSWYTWSIPTTVCM